MTEPQSPELERALASMFAPLDKRALGVAFGVALALSVALATVLSMVLDPQHRLPLILLDQYFFGYTVSATGALVGAAWGFVTGFVWGWFLAFCRNLVLAIWLMTVRVRADLSSTRGFLDDI
jgi:hypothetical protein